MSGNYQGIEGWDPVEGVLKVAPHYWDSNVLAWVKGTQSGGIAASVSVSNFPSSFSVSNFPATQPVSGTFFQATQPVSAVSLPLPSNAAAETGGNLATAAAYLLAIGNQNANIVTATQTTATSGATAANQSTVITSLSSVDSKLGTLDSRSSAFSVSERLFQLSLKMDKLATEATLRQLVVKPVAKKLCGTLLHRSS